MTLTLIPAPPEVRRPSWGEDEEAVFLVLVPREARDCEGVHPTPLTMDWGTGDTLIMFTERETVERFVASPVFVEVEPASIIKGAPVDVFIEVLGMCVEDGFVEQVLPDPIPFHEWGDGYRAGVFDAAGLHAALREEFLGD
jgi:hypothetical protein